MPRVAALIVAVLLALGLAACAAGTSSHPLLAHDYHAMTDSGLLQYYGDLAEAAQICEARANRASGVQVGGMVGAGTSGVGGGVGLGLEPQVRGCDPAPLWERRMAVGREIHARGLTP